MIGKRDLSFEDSRARSCSILAAPRILIIRQRKYVFVYI